jgi:hypothetical protein
MLVDAGAAFRRPLWVVGPRNREASAAVPFGFAPHPDAHPVAHGARLTRVLRPAREHPAPNGDEAAEQSWTDKAKEAGQAVVDGRKSGTGEIGDSPQFPGLVP